MPIELPKLDDRNYDELVEEGLNLIPSYAPTDWTNHNPSDPGITLVELFAYFTELLNYRLNRIGRSNMLAFLQLLNGPDWVAAENSNLNDEIRSAILALRQRNRAVTCEDFVTLALEADPNIARAQCIPRGNYASSDSQYEGRPGHVGIIVVLHDPIDDSTQLAAFHAMVETYFEDKRLLTTRVYVTSPGYLGNDAGIGIRLAIVLKPGALHEEFTGFSIPRDDPQLSSGDDIEMLTKLVDVFKLAQEAKEEGEIVYELSDDLSFDILGVTEWLIIDNVFRQTYTVREEEAILYIYKDVIRTQAMRALQDFFDPLIGGPEGAGWPFGRNVYVSEVYQILDMLPGVDFATNVIESIPLDELIILDAEHSGRARYNETDELVALEVLEHELVRLAFDQIAIAVIRTET